MILAALLTILIDGSPVATSQPARIVAGRTMAPLVPIITRIADVIRMRQGRMLVIERGRRSVSLTVAEDVFCAECIYVPLAAVVRGLGGDVRYDPRAKSIALSFEPGPLRTPEPYDILALPRPGTTTLPWPTPPNATPRPAVVDVPRPRRTPVEVRVPGL
ncbi:MAG TPA: hypothetical protein VN905_12710 [Candidatus Binatia bacterium]|nr:hypothetical protein [Candidatus Binatia bacterium]